MSRNEDWNRNVLKRSWKVDRDGADITLSGRLFQMVDPGRPTTGKARPPTLDSFTDWTVWYCGKYRDVKQTNTVLIQLGMDLE